ncbi:MAG: hypothetical protein KGH72_05140 [Candidatus Micrarchaeota archaeon]|nr:hypothetical protein [Candidatus Micrarchaeota archaeon]
MAVRDRLAEKGIGHVRILVPLMYGERQLKILSEEQHEDPFAIYLDEGFGKMLREVVFENGDFAQHLSRLNSRFDAVSGLVSNRFAIDAPPIEARSLGTGSTVWIYPSDVIATIDTAARIPVPAPKRYFAFPTLTSEILAEAQEQPGCLGFSRVDMEKVRARMAEMEAGYSQVFIPEVNSLSFKYADDLSGQPTVIEGRSRVYTPATKAEVAPTSGNVDIPGIYAMFSGTKATREQNLALVSHLRESGIAVYMPEWETTVQGAIPISPSVLPYRNIMAIFGRSGWGTGWQAQNLAKPWLVTPYHAGDDPEICFNNMTIEALGIGKVLDPGRLDMQELKRLLRDLPAGVEAVNSRIREKFGTLDGIAYTAGHVAEDLATS